MIFVAPVVFGITLLRSIVTASPAVAADCQSVKNSEPDVVSSIVNRIDTAPCPEQI